MSERRMPTLHVLGYELEIRPYSGWWSRYEGRVVRLIQWNDAKPQREHYLPGKPGYNVPRPWWQRSRDRARLKRELTAMLNDELKRQRAEQPERIELTDTMAGWQ